MTQDTLMLGGKEFHSRFILGSGKYSLELIQAAVNQAGAEMVTLAVRRTNTKDTENILDYIPEHVTLLPNTSGARDAKEAVRIARMARELGCGNFVKVEIMKDSKYLLPDNVETVKATQMLADEGFVVLPYMYPDLYTARDLVKAGAAAVMPLTIGILGTAFKADTDDVRYSAALYNTAYFVSKGYTVKHYDPKATDNFLKSLPDYMDPSEDLSDEYIRDHIVTCSRAEDVFDDADAVILMTDWDEFRELNMENLVRRMANNVFIDARNQFNGYDMVRYGFDYYGIGKGI